MNTHAVLNWKVLDFFADSLIWIYFPHFQEVLKKSAMTRLSLLKNQPFNIPTKVKSSLLTGSRSSNGSDETSLLRRYDTDPTSSLTSISSMLRGEENMVTRFTVSENTITEKTKSGNTLSENTSNNNIYATSRRGRASNRGYILPWWRPLRAPYKNRTVAGDLLRENDSESPLCPKTDQKECARDDSSRDGWVTYDSSSDESSDSDGATRSDEPLGRFHSV